MSVLKYSIILYSLYARNGGVSGATSPSQDFTTAHGPCPYMMDNNQMVFSKEQNKQNMVDNYRQMVIDPMIFSKDQAKQVDDTRSDANVPTQPRNVAAYTSPISAADSGMSREINAVTITRSDAARMTNTMSNSMETGTPSTETLSNNRTRTLTATATATATPAKPNHAKHDMLPGLSVAFAVILLFKLMF
jgi:hypothetical protein